VAYSIAEIILVTMAAWFSALLGRQRFYTLSLALFIAASVWCGFARSLEMMIVGRALQGIGGGGLIPLSHSACPSSCCSASAVCMLRQHQTSLLR
jgi:MFS transporter, DHA2 family, multidrug resistance protein